MLTIHHLGKSQSERIIWLCEELGVPYDLKRYKRDSVTILSPPELKALHPMGAAPVITEGNLILGESAAITDYIIARHGNGRLTLRPDHKDFASYLYWFHFANGNLQPVMGRNMMLGRLNLPSDNPVLLDAKRRLKLAISLVEQRLDDAAFLAGDEFTAADIMTVFSLTTMRYFLPVDLSPYPNILAYLQSIAGRDAYQRAWQNGDPDMEQLLT